MKTVPRRTFGADGFPLDKKKTTQDQIEEIKSNIFIARERLKGGHLTIDAVRLYQSNLAESERRLEQLTQQQEAAK